jgi:hypothetical protein
MPQPERQSASGIGSPIPTVGWRLCPLLVRSSQPCGEAPSSQHGASCRPGCGLGRERGGRRFGDRPVVAKDRIAKTAVRRLDSEAQRKVALVQGSSASHALDRAERRRLRMHHARSLPGGAAPNRQGHSLSAGAARPGDAIQSTPVGECSHEAVVRLWRRGPRRRNVFRDS